MGWIVTPLEHRNEHRNDPQKNVSQYGIGVQRRKNGRFRALAQVDGRKYSLGTYSTPEDAQQARSEFLARLRDEPEPAPVTRKKGREFTQVPTALIMGWTTLGLKPVDLQVVLAVRTFWRPKNNVPPYPAIQTIADMIGVSRSTVQRSLGRMVEKGYLRKGNVPGYPRGMKPRTLDFSGLWNAAEKGCHQLAASSVALRGSGRL